eukprot:3539149-Amphidinium_carterae.1
MSLIITGRTWALLCRKLCCVCDPAPKLHVWIALSFKQQLDVSAAAAAAAELHHALQAARLSGFQSPVLQLLHIRVICGFDLVIK